MLKIQILRMCKCFLLSVVFQFSYFFAILYRIGWYCSDIYGYPLLLLSFLYCLYMLLWFFHRPFLFYFIFHFLLILYTHRPNEHHLFSDCYTLLSLSFFLCRTSPLSNFSALSLWYCDQLKNEENSRFLFFGLEYVSPLRRSKRGTKKYPKTQEKC